MADNNMIINVSFPGIDKKPAPVRSLANFMMQNSSVYFKRGEADISAYGSRNETIYGVSDYVNFISFVESKDKSNIDDTLVYIQGNLVSTDSPSESISINEVCRVYRWHDLDDISGRPAIRLMLPKPTAGNWSGYDGLSIYSIDEPSVEKSDLLSFADEHSITIYPFTYSSDHIALDDSTVNGKVYLSGIATETVGGEINLTPIISEPLLVENGEFDIDPSAVNIDSLVISEKPLVPAPKLPICGNILHKYGMYVYGNFSPSYEMYIKYDDESFKPVEKPTRASGTAEGISFNVVANELGPAGNKYKLVFTEKLPEESDVGLYVEVYENGEKIGRGGGLWSDNNLNGVYTYETNYILYNVNINGYSLGELFTFVDDRNKFANMVQVDFNQLPIEVQLAGGAETGGNYDIIDNVSDEYSLFKCNTELCPASTELCIGGFYLDKGSDGIVTKESIPNIPVTITPTIGSNVNTDRNITISEYNDNGIAISSLTPRNSVNDILEIDYQLRTTSFTVRAQNSSNTEHFENPVFSDVYYKIGVCPADGSEKTRDKLLDVLEHSMLGMYQNYYMDYEEYSSHYVTLYSSQMYEQVMEPGYRGPYGAYPSEFMLYDRDIMMSGHPGDDPTVQFPKSMCIPLIERKFDYDNEDYVGYNDKFVGFMYMKLFNTDGSQYTLNKPLEVTYIKENESDTITEEDDPATNLILPLKRDMLDGGFYNDPKVNYYYMRYFYGE